MLNAKAIYTPEHILRGGVFASHHLYWLSVWIFFLLFNNCSPKSKIQINQNDS